MNSGAPRTADDPRVVVGVFAVGVVVVLLGATTGACTTSNPSSACAGYVCGFYTGAAGDTGTDAAANQQSVPPPADVNAVWKSSGCGRPVPAMQPATVTGTSTGYLQYHVAQTGATLTGTDPTRAGDRTFWVRVPADYDPNRAYRIVYMGQGCGPYQKANQLTYAVYSASLGGTEEAVYVALDIPKDQANMNCYDTEVGPGSQEYEAFALIQSIVEQTYCVDDNRIFVDSYAGGEPSLSNLWGCYFTGDPTPPRRFAPNRHVRAQASVEDIDPHDMPPCGGPVAALWIHDLDDSSQPYAQNLVSLDRVLKSNGCQGDHTNSPSVPWAPMADVCVQYTTCPADYPVVFCTTMGQGAVDQHARAIPAFTMFEDMLPTSETAASQDAATADAGSVSDAVPAAED